MKHEHTLPNGNKVYIVHGITGVLAVRHYDEHAGNLKGQDRYYIQSEGTELFRIFKTAAEADAYVQGLHDINESDAYTFTSPEDHAAIYGKFSDQLADILNPKQDEPQQPTAAAELVYIGTLYQHFHAGHDIPTHHIDDAITMAVKFEELHRNTNWDEEQPDDWKETLYNYYQENKPADWNGTPAEQLLNARADFLRNISRITNTALTVGEEMEILGALAAYFQESNGVI